MKKQLYYGFWSANNSTFSGYYTDTNKIRLNKMLREVAIGNTFQGNEGCWTVLNKNPEDIDENEDIDNYTIYKGHCTAFGQTIYTIKR